MAFDTLLVNTAVKVTKDNIKFNESIDKLKMKLLDSGKNFLSEAGINKIPNLDKIINGINFDNPSSTPPIDINNLIDPTTLSQIGEIPNSEEILNNLNKFESTLNTLISTKNRLTNVLTKTQSALEITRKTADTLNKVLTGIDVSVKLLKILPIPTAYPPGIGIPLGIINTFSDILDKLSDYIKKGKGPLSQIPKVLKIINNSINDILNKLNSLDKLILSLLQIIVILKTLLKYGPNASKEEIDEIIKETSNNLDFTSTGNNSSLVIDSLNEDALLKCLSSNTNDPCIYRGFLLNVEYNPNNKFSFPSRRIKGYNKEINRLVYNNSIYESDNPEGYSFSSSLETLLEEIKYVIDTYLSESNIEIPNEEIENIIDNEPKYPPFGEEGKDGEIRKFMSEYYKYNDSLKQWAFISLDLSPFNEVGNFDGETREIEMTEEETEIKEERIYEWDIFDGKKKYKITTITYSIINISTYTWSNSSYKWIFKNKETKDIVEKYRKIKIIKK